MHLKVKETLAEIEVLLGALREKVRGEAVSKDELERELAEALKWLRVRCVEAERYEETAPPLLGLKRIVPLFLTMLVELGAAGVFAYYSGVLAKAPVLASFMPLISAIAGNHGLQTASAAIRALALQSARGFLPCLIKEVAIGLFCGVCMGVSAGVIAYIWHGSVLMGLIVTVVMVCSLMTSAVFGVVAPFFFKWVGFDPALTAGPFETAMQDITTYGIYLFLLSLFLK
jgi:magnesium transporter